LGDLGVEGLGNLKVLLGGTARSPDDVVFLHGLGLGFAEIPITNPDKFLGRLEDYQALRDDLGVYYLCHGPREGDPNNTDTLENIYLPKLIHILSIMPRLKMDLLTIHLWLDTRFVSARVIEYKVGLLTRLLKRAADSAIRLCVENLSEKAEHLAPVFDALPSLSLTLDLGHAQLLSDENTSFGFMERSPDRIAHIHVHDNRGGNTPAEDLHLPVGDGTVDFAAIFRALTQMGYNRTMTLELKPAEISGNLDRVERMLKAAGFSTGAIRQPR